MRAFLTLLLLALLPAMSQAATEQELVDAARAQIGKTVRYDKRYLRIAYPNGDVPIEVGVCTDVIVRAYRTLGVDLQQKVHEDMVANWGEYPKRWRNRKPDTNIDHRRVPNLGVWFLRQHAAQPITREKTDYKPGDVVSWRLPGGLPHIGIVSEKKSTTGVPLIIHNIGHGAREENLLFSFPITGHYRWLPPAK